MLTAIAIVPSAPVMVPQLAASAAAETSDLRNAAFAAVARLPKRWIAVGAAPLGSIHGPDTAGTFGGYGVDIRVGLSEGSVGDEPVPLPLSVLVAAWLRGQAHPQATVEAHVYRAELDVGEAVAAGATLRATLDAADDAFGVLVVADGANTLTPSAPGGYRPETVPVQAALDDALTAGDAAALARVSGDVVGRVALHVLAGLVGTGPRRTEELYRGAPFGVGYYVGVWTP